MLRALLLAPPGAGKGTQGTRLASDHGVPHLATGDMLRAEVARASPTGRAARTYMDRGALVPDDLVVQLIRGRFAGPPRLEGYVLDGFPRTLAQAKEAHRWALHNDRTFHAAISLVVPDDELVLRLLERGRRSGRTDDNEATIGDRLKVYRTSTEPLLEYYRGREILLEVDGTGSVDEVATRIRDAVGPVVTDP